MEWHIIKTGAEYERAMSRITKIFDADPHSPEGKEAELLVTLIEKYEGENYPIDLPDPIEAIKERKAQLGLKDKDLVEAIGSKSGVSLILNKRRHLTVEMIRKLSALLTLPSEVLIQPYELMGEKKNQSPPTIKPLSHFPQ